MSNQVYTLFDDLKKYRETDKKNQNENYFTEILKWYLNNDSYFRDEVFKILEIPMLIDVNFKSQFQLFNKNGFMDLFAETQNEIIIIENKIGASVSEKQLRLYFNDTVERLSSKNCMKIIYMRLIAKDYTYLENEVISKLKNDGMPLTHTTWLELYENFQTNIDSTYKSSIIWKLLDSYFISSGLLRRRLLTSYNISDMSFLKGQTLSLMEDLSNEIEIIKELAYYRKVFKIIDSSVDKKIDYRWGRIGINLREATPYSSKNWWPNLFLGIILDNSDHKLKSFNNPKVVVIVEWSNKKESSALQKSILDDWTISLNNFKFNNQSENTKIYLNFELENKWRFIVIEKDLKHFIDKKNLKIQDKEFIEFFIEWLKKLNNNLFLQSIFKSK